MIKTFQPTPKWIFTPTVGANRAKIQQKTGTYKSVYLTCYLTFPSMTTQILGGAK